MSNLERQPAEALLDEPAHTDAIELLHPRDVPLGGPRAMRVRRTLPQRSRSLIGAWCFVDHYGPDDVSGTTGMIVPPHPHTGLQTVSWLFAGEIEHRDSAGSHAMVLPGELNLMTAGRGIQHSEMSTASATSLHGAQLWVALPDTARHTEPRFDHYAPEPFDHDGATVSVFIGTFAGQTSPVATHTPLLGAQLDLPGGARIELDVDPRFEHGVLVDKGSLTVDSEAASADTLVFVPAGRGSLTLEALEGTRVLLLGGTPLGERIVMWWNFVGRSHDEIVAFREQWQLHVDRGSDETRFGGIPDDAPPLPAPVMPNVRLRDRG